MKMFCVVLCATVEHQVGLVATYGKFIPLEPTKTIRCKYLMNDICKLPGETATVF